MNDVYIYNVYGKETMSEVATIGSEMGQKNNGVESDLNIFCIYYQMKNTS